ncbi:pyridoxamine 5'-phosphate oxidase family protein [Pseudaestuariivita sp.]|uniref:pyridoxamine 5'-phosphate oxidase family protein n=1 Tax=Pseudaestuariivita sp. TaxID=2211669 RepID=UPI00405A1C38
MGKQFDALSEQHIAFIKAQPLFFSGSAAREGKVNVSPKGMDCLRVLSPTRILWRNLTGSGNETATHLSDSPRMTLMWCSFDRKPMILRTYGTACAIHRQDADWTSLDGHFAPDFAARQLFDLSIEMVQTSCGYAVPFMDNPRPRDTLVKWAEDKGPEGVETYWQERNTTTLDGIPTRIAEKSLP